ncbi:hypothetical protein B0H10DRAFT_635055, partial [Mycena sp. CBHHK59/15]
MHELYRSEQWWRDHQEWLYTLGYLLRPRYHPGWTAPSGREEELKRPVCTAFLQSSSATLTCSRAGSWMWYAHVTASPLRSSAFHTRRRRRKNASCAALPQTHWYPTRTIRAPRSIKSWAYRMTS